MNIDRYAWASGEPLPDCPEKRFLLAFIIQLIQDAQAYGEAPPQDHSLPEYRESVSIHRQCITGDQFRWWCETLNMSPWRLAAFINDVINSKETISRRQLRVGKAWQEYEQIGFQAADKEYVRELSRSGVIKREANRIAKKEAIRNAKKQAVAPPPPKRKGIGGTRGNNRRISIQPNRHQ